MFTFGIVNEGLPCPWICDQKSFLKYYFTLHDIKNRATLHSGKLENYRRSFFHTDLLYSDELFLNSVQREELLLNFTLSEFGVIFVTDSLKAVFIFHEICVRREPSVHTYLECINLDIYALYHYSWKNEGSKNLGLYEVGTFLQKSSGSSRIT